MRKNVYCLIDTETVGGASNPTGMYNLAGFIHDRKGNIICSFNYLVAELYDEIAKDSYAKKNFHKYEEMVKNGEITMVATERDAINNVKSLCDFYNVNICTAFNTGFDYTKTVCRELLENREFIDLYLASVQTILTKRYANFCFENVLQSKSKKSIATSAESFYAYLVNDSSFSEEHIALDDCRIELEIFKAIMKTHKKIVKNCHFFDYFKEHKCWKTIPAWV